MPAHRSFVLLLAFAMALGALVPLVAPPRTDAISTDIVISEFRTRGSAGAADEFVELHNRSGLAVDVSGWLVRRSNNTGFNATQVTIPAGTSIGPGCFYLVANSAGYSGSSAADATYSVGIADDGGIGVQTPGGAVVDAVGMSALSFYQEGTNLAPLTANTDQGYERKPGGTTGHTDTDDNATDFAVLAPSNPQNSSSPCLTITGPTSPSGVGTANPPSVEPGDTSLLSVTVTPGANPASTGVTVTGNLSSITGYSDAEEFADPDLDNVFTFQITVPETEAPGTRNLGITVADAQGRSSTTSIALTVEAPPTSIWEIQGAGHLSPYDDQQVFGVEGVVTATRIGNSGGFWMTHPTGDGDPATSDGIFIFKPGTQAVAVGDAVSVSGTVDEFRPGFDAGFENLTITEIINPSVTVMSSGNPLPVTVIGDGGRMPPSDVIDDDTLADGGGGDGTIDGPGAVTTYDPANDGIDFYESLEGMYVQVNDAVAVGPRTGVGEIAIVGDGGDHAGPFTSRGGLIIGPGAFNPERIHLDDALRPTPMVNVGDTFTTAVNGVIDYSFGNFKLLPTTALVGVDNGLVREAADATGPRELAVATYNVENLTVGNPQAKFDELADQIIHNLRSPDLIAIEEMQDDSGGTNNGVVTAQQGWAKLITTIANRGGPVYQFRSIDPANNADGGAFGGNIRVGFLFRTDRGLEFVDRPGGNATTDTGVVATPNGKAARLTISPGRVLPDPAGPHANAFVDTRKSLAGEFRWRGETLFVVANHLSSKGDDHPLFGRFQPPVRFTEFASGTPEDGWRHAQAQVLNDFVDKILAVDEDAHVIVLGDINDFHDSETVGVLTGELVAGSGGPDLDGSGPTLASGDAPVLATLFDGLPADERYSYVFEGNSQVLDQILVSTSLVALDPRYDVVHVNAEFASQASDHDPSVMRVSFQPRRGR